MIGNSQVLVSVSVLFAALALTACGGGTTRDDPTPPAADCGLAGQQAWLANYMDDWYFWYAHLAAPQRRAATAAP